MTLGMTLIVPIEVWFVLFNGLTLVSIRTFSVMYDQTFSQLPNHQIGHEAASGLSPW